MDQEQKRSNVVVINESVLSDKRLTPIEKMVYARIAYFELFWEKCETTAEHLGLKARSVKAAKQNLECLGYIFCVENTGRGKKYVADVNLGVVKDETLRTMFQNLADKKDEHWEQYQKKKQENCHQKDTKLSSDGQNTSIRRTPDVHQKDAKCPSEGQNTSIRGTKSVRIYKNIDENDGENLGESGDERGKHNIVSNDTKPKRKVFVKPTVEEIKAYCLERNNQVDAERFFDYYEANGWKVGRNPMKDWKASVRTWERNGYSNGNAYQPNNSQAIAERAEMTPEVEDMFDFWKQVMRVSCPRDNENVKACKELLEDAGEDGTKRLIMGLMFRGKHGYLPATVTNIVDFVGLNRNKVAMQTFCDKHWDYWQQLMKAASTGKNIWEVY